MSRKTPYGTRSTNAQRPDRLAAIRERRSLVAVAFPEGKIRLKGRSPERSAWAGMLRRCRAEGGHSDYGARGIRVCQRWHSFENFLVDMGFRPSPRHSLERDDVNGDYEPSNCRWATRKQQARNKRTTRWIEYGGFKWSMAELAEAHGLKPMTLRQRLARGLSVEDAVSAPLRRGGA